MMVVWHISDYCALIWLSIFGAFHLHLIYYMPVYGYYNMFIIIVIFFHIFLSQKTVYGLSGEPICMKED